MQRQMKEQEKSLRKKQNGENQDGGIDRHTAPPRTTRTDRELNGKGVRHQGDKK